MQEIEPLFDFSTNESSILIRQSQVEISINQHTYTGSGEVRLELLPRAGIYLYGYFQGVPAKDALDARFMRSKISSFLFLGGSNTPPLCGVIVLPHESPDSKKS